MRETKFRGRRLDNGKFVYGDLIQSKPNKVDGKHSLWIKERTILALGAISAPTDNFIQVDPETVGQYTGLKDKNGVEIYEGDILLKNCSPQKGVVEFKDGCFVINYGDDSNFIAYRNVFEVIGNIYQDSHLLNENPDLLEGEK